MSIKSNDRDKNQHLDYLIDPCFHIATRLFVLSFQNGYFLPTIKIKDYNAMIDGRNFFDHPV